MKKLLKPLTLLILTTSLASCVSVRSDKYLAIKPEDMKVSSVKKSKMFIDWGFRTPKIDRGEVNSDNKYHQIMMNEVIAKQKLIFSEAIKESGCCDLVNEKSGADIIVEGAFHNVSSQAGLYACFISGLTLTVIPCWSNSQIKVTAKVSNGRMVKDYEIKDSFLMTIWAPLILATPFNGPLNVEKEVNTNLYKTLLTQMKKDEFFGKITKF